MTSSGPDEQHEVSDFMNVTITRNNLISNKKYIMRINTTRERTAAVGGDGMDHHRRPPLGIQQSSSSHSHHSPSCCSSFSSSHICLEIISNTRLTGIITFDHPPASSPCASWQTKVRSLLLRRHSHRPIPGIPHQLQLLTFWQLARPPLPRRDLFFSLSPDWYVFALSVHRSIDCN